MANKNTPAHDFAPAWLKIPTYDTVKPSGADGQHSGHTSRRDEHTSSFARHTKENNSVISHHSFTDSRRERDALSGERKPSYTSSYHQSLDFDDCHYPLSSAQYYSGESSVNGLPASSQPALLRRPHSRHDFRNIPMSYSKVDTLSRITNSNSGYYGNKSKGKLRDSCSNSNSHNNISRGMGVTSNNFNQEFPSLQGGITEEPAAPLPTANGSVWEKPRNIKIHSSGIGKKIQLVKKLTNADVSPDNSLKNTASLTSGPAATSISSTSNPHTVIVTPIAKGSSGIYRALVPAKSSLSKKPSKEGMTKITLKKPVTSPPATHSMEILVKHPKAPGNKSEFLKALRNENKEMEEGQKNNKNNHCNDKNNENSKEKVDDFQMNGIEIGKLSFDEDEAKKTLLSSSLEAEERLLREMGWKEEALNDENYAPLTEDELREFREITEKIGKKNGIRCSLQKNVSPRCLAPFTNVSLPTDSCSSSESDSDF